ncbi:ABC transporter substrate-binding protein [Desulfocurvibacter africanus]|uniref:Extracellular ligand-binding receptor n=1 Tax=Desulfocurvibacter africanus subsp. africanus str. Walvis Bay TaxID=690850 RepID=F3YY95_DESAF|nr:ABC transporter substrate-binding protein [Desulfocurvibacter africanus]EGJ49539.1 Extracellular ligand-binding receptor [Desulfocurvibacter africanus subsp. africanus str. Walvis Bay]
MLHRALLVLIMFLIAAPASAMAEDVILVGGLFAESGPAAFVGTPSRLVAEMAVEEINAAGGVLGKKLKLIIYDTESDANLALRNARKLVEQDKVLAIIGPTSTGSGMAMKQYIEGRGVPVLMTVGGDPVIAGGRFGPYKWTFKVPQRTSTAVRKIYTHLKAKGVTRIALLTATDGFGKDGAEQLQKLAPEFGLNVVASEVMDAKGNDFSAQAFKLAIAKPEAVIVWTIGPAGAIASKNFHTLPGQKPLIIQSHGQPDPKFVELAGPAAEGVLMPGTKIMIPAELSGSDPQRALITKFLAEYARRGLDRQFPINTHSGYAYDAVLLLKDALTRAGKADPEALRQALESAKGVVGISGVFTIGPEDHNGLDTDSLAMLMVRNGKFTLAK